MDGEFDHCKDANIPMRQTACTAQEPCPNNENAPLEENPETNENTLELLESLRQVMGPLKVSVKDGSEKKKRVMTMEMKHEIIDKHDRGVRVSDLARQYGRSTSTICTILKQKDAIKSTKPSKGITIMSKLRTSINDEMERLLLLWIKEKQVAGDIITKAVVCEKASVIYNDLKKKEAAEGGETSTTVEPFKASRGWFHNFKKRTGIHAVKRHKEAASLDVKAAEEYVKCFTALIAVEDCIPQQALNCDQTEHFWERMSQTFIMEEENELPGHSGNGEISSEEEVKQEEGIPSSEIEEVLAKWQDVSDFLEKNHPDKMSTGHALAFFDDACLTHFRNILKRRQKQSSLDRFLFESRATCESENQSEVKRAKKSEELQKM